MISIPYFQPRLRIKNNIHVISQTPLTAARHLIESTMPVIISTIKTMKTAIENIPIMVDIRYM